MKLNLNILVITQFIIGIKYSCTYNSRNTVTIVKYRDKNISLAEKHRITSFERSKLNCNDVLAYPEGLLILFNK